MSRFWRQLAYLFILTLVLTGLTASPAFAAGSQSGTQFFARATP